MHEIIENEALTGDVDGRVVRLANRLASATGEATPYGLSLLTHVVHTYRKGLAGDLGDEAAEHMAWIALDNLVDPLDRARPEFWGTPLGRACAWWVGGHPRGAAMDRRAAAAALGCSRQNVAELVQRGTLIGTAGGGVMPESLRDLLRARYPRSA
jgi:hypothetical protein